MNILILDDPIESLSAISDQIANTDIEVSRIWEISEARKLLSSEEFNVLIISAISLFPDKIELCKEFKKGDPKRITILYGPHIDNEDDENFLKEVCFDHIFKSITREEIRRICEVFHLNSQKRQCEIKDDYDGVRLMDITKEVTENVLRDMASKAQKLEEILENSTDVIYELDPYGRIVLISKAIEKLTGYDRDELMGMSALEMTSPESVEVVADHLTKLISGYEEPIAVEVGVQAKNGHVIPAEMIVRPVWHKSQVVGILGIGRNVEERKRLENRLKMAISEREFYLDLMAHDIQNFNQAIMGYLEMIISKENLDDGISRYARGAFRQVTQIANLIAHIKRVAQIRQAGKKKMDKMDIRKILQDSVMKLQSRIEENSVAISFDSEEGQYPIMATDDIRDLLDLIIVSATRYSISDLLHLRMRLISELFDGRKYWTIEITGNNLRLSEPIVRCVMSPDYSGCQMMDRPDLQLLVARAIVETIGGQLDIKTAINGKGDGFVIRLPQAE